MSHESSTVRLACAAAALAAMIAGATTAAAQQEMSIRAQGVRPYTVELAAVFGAAPGVGVGAEAFFMPKVAAFGEFAYLDATIPGNVIEDIQRANDAAVVKTAVGNQAMAGVRWYASPHKSSWYAGAGVGYADSKSKWDYENLVVDSRLATVLPTLRAGYRILLQNNLVMRLGAGASTNQIQTHTTTVQGTGDKAATAETKVRDVQRQPVIASVDLGLGYAF